MPSVVFYSEPSGWLGTMINGSLWSIFHELACYVLLALVGLVGLLRWWTMALVSVGMVLASLAGMSLNSSTMSDFLLVAPAYFAGAALSLVEFQQMKPMYRFVTVIAASCAIALACRDGALLAIFPVAGAPIILLIGTSRWLRLPALQRVGDISYGTYLYGWPVEQVARSLAGPHPGWEMIFSISLPVAYALGYSSWWAVERPLLQYKSMIRNLAPAAGKRVQSS